mmetsp:Transcript_19595/g.55713  ORF Transcript_19595/g.55713 Transcript_19595/m.55713 type:complete len:103 (-) Transcript_19595:1364-1672(-)
MFTSVGTFAGDWDRSFRDDDRRTEAVVVGTVSQPSSLIIVRLFAERSRLTRVGLRPAFFVLLGLDVVVDLLDGLGLLDFAARHPRVFSQFAKIFQREAQPRI